MADGKFTPKPRDKNILDSKRFVLSTPCPVKGVKGFSELHYYANNDNPGITVYTRDPGDKDNNFGRIQAKMGVLDMQGHLEQLQAAINSKEAVYYEMFCQSPRGQDKKRVDVAVVEVGKRQDGVVYIKVKDLELRGRPEIEFSFAPTYWHHMAKNGVPQTEAEMSVIMGRAVYNFVSKALVHVSATTYKHPEPKQPNGGGGGYNRGGNGGGGNNYRGNGGGGGGGNYNRGGDSEASGGGYSSGGETDFDDIQF